ncbi:hypothetical protein [Mycobacterium decipiens]
MPLVRPDITTQHGVQGDVPVAVRSVLVKLALRERIPSTELGEAFAACLELPVPVRDVVMGSVMTAVMLTGPDVDAVETLLRIALSLDGLAAEQIPHEGINRPIIVLAGSGKKGERTLNVSTPAALLAAAAGAAVVKVGSTATSSALGSRDLMRSLGIIEDESTTEVQRSLQTCGFSFVAIEPRIPQLDQVYGSRFYAPNPFSFGLAALVSPVRGDLMLFGLAHPRVDVSAQVLYRFGLDNVDVISTRTAAGRYIDELGPAGQVLLARVDRGILSDAQAMPALSFTRRGFDEHLLPAPEDADTAVERTLDLLAGNGLASHRRVVTLNAGYLLTRSRITATLPDGIDLAEEVLRSGAVSDLVRLLGSVDRQEQTA